LTDCNAESWNASHSVPLALQGRLVYLLPRFWKGCHRRNRDARYNIDLIVDSILPKQTAYCINPKVHKILQPQEEGLVKKESIMEDLILDFVPNFLVPPNDEYFQAYVGKGDLNTNLITEYDLIKYECGNVVVDELLRKYILISTLDPKVLEFDSFKGSGGTNLTFLCVSHKHHMNIERFKILSDQKKLIYDYGLVFKNLFRRIYCKNIGKKMILKN